MLRLPGCTAAVLVLCLALSAAGGAEAAKVGELAGSVMVQHGGGQAATEVGADTIFASGDVVTCTPDSRVQLMLTNGSVLSLVGPAEVQLAVIQTNLTKVVLISGLINVARARRGKMVIDTEYPAHMTISNSTGYAEVVPGDLMRFASREGESVVVHLHGEEDRPQKTGELPFIIDLKKLKLVRKPVEVFGGEDIDGPASATGEMLPPKDVYRLGKRLVRIYPKDKVTVEMMSDGGLRIVGAGLGENEFARVEVGFEAVLYLGEGDRVVLDQYGHVDEFSGISFLDRPLDRRSFRYAPVKDSADTSPIRTRAR